MACQWTRGATAIALIATLNSSNVGADGTGARTRRFESVIPPGAFAFVSFPDLERSNELYGQTALFDLWREPEVQTFLKEIVVAIERQNKETLDRVQVSADECAQLKLGQVGISVGVDGTDSWGIAIGIQVRSNVEKASSLARQLLDQAMRMMASASGVGSPKIVERQYQGQTIRSTAVPGIGLQGKDIDLCYTFVDSLFVGALNRGYLEKIIDTARDPKAPNLSTSPLFQAAVSKVQSPATTFLGFVNVQALRQRFADLIPAEVMKALQALGVDLVQAFAVAESVEGKLIRDTFYVHAPGERRGLIKSCAMSPNGLATARLAPRDAVFFDSNTLDLRALVDGFLEIIKNNDPSAHARAIAEIQQVEQLLGFRLREDLLASFGSEMATFLALPAGGSPIPEFGMAVKLRDPTSCARFIDAIPFDKLGVHAKRLEFNGVSIQYLDLASAMVPIAPALCVSGNFLFVGGSVQTLKQMVSRFQSNDEGLLGNTSFKAVRGKIPADASWVDFVDLSRIAAFMVNSIGPMLGPLAKESHLPLDPALLPTADTVAKHLGSYVGFLRSDADGFTSSCESAVGSGFLLLTYAGILVNISMQANGPYTIADKLEDTANGGSLSPRERAARDRMAGRWEAAQRHYSEAIGKEPNDPSLYFERGTVNHALKHYTSAREDFQRAAKGGHFPDRCHYWIARTFAVEGDTESALRALEQAANCGYPRPSEWANEGDFAALKSNDRFRSLVEPR
ncbi:MAG: hypothetical protein HYR85_07180 [Planctomycetes bacterium]|nr:hypothetical protein [Planctomycetota bacterium]MBI3848533.1 hypothetical protein [Planctomycetota bacterium]